MTEQDPQPGDDAQQDAEPRRTAKGEGERRELGKRALAAARRAAESKAVIPHLYALGRIEIGGGQGTPAEAALLAAVGTALREWPQLNSAYRDGVISEHGRVNVGVVTEGADGPLVPTLFDADRGDVGAIDKELAAMRAAAISGSLTSPDLAGGTFTVTLLAESAGPLLAPVPLGQAAHLAVSAPRPAAVVRDGRCEAGQAIALGLACDARAVSAREAAAFLRRVEELAAAGPGGAAG